MPEVKVCAVIVAAYRAEAWIGDLLASFAAQRPCPGWRYEIRLGVDGCEATSQCLTNRNVPHWFAKNNVGPYVLRNSLIGLRPADAYAIFDADDVMHPEYLAASLAGLSATGLVLTARINVDAGLRELEEARTRGVFTVSQAVWQRLGGYVGMRCAADSDFIKRARMLGVRLHILPVPLFFRRRHAGSLTQDPATTAKSQTRRLAIQNMTRRRQRGELMIKPVTTPLVQRSPRISVSIMAHPSRAAFIPAIHDKLGFACPVAWDRISNRWDTGKRAWQLHDPGATHHLVLQDDVILSRDLMAALPHLIRVAPDRPISLFARNKKRWNPLIQKCMADRQHVRWLVLQRLNWGPAVLLPTADINPMLAWVDAHCHMPNYDVRIGYWYLTQNRPVWYTMPSLVDHRIEGDSLVWKLRSQANRYAKFFIGEDRCGAEIDWRGQAVQETIPLKVYREKTAAINEKYRLEGVNSHIKGGK